MIPTSRFTTGSAATYSEKDLLEKRCVLRIHIPYSVFRNGFHAKSTEWGVFVWTWKFLSPVPRNSPQQKKLHYGIFLDLSSFPCWTNCMAPWLESYAPGIVSHLIEGISWGVCIFNLYKYRACGQFTVSLSCSRISCLVIFLTHLEQFRNSRCSFHASIVCLLLHGCLQSAILCMW